MPQWMKLAAPVALAVLIALIPAPAGLAPHAWLYFAIFAGVVVALVLEPLPGALIGLVGVTLVALLSPYVLYSAAELARPGFRPANASLTWALSGFSNGTVWLIFAAFMFALGYEKSGLGRRIALLLVRAMGRRTLTLGYAIALADLALAPFTPSNTARSGGTIFRWCATCHHFMAACRMILRRGASVGMSCGRRWPPPASPPRCSSPHWRQTFWPWSWRAARRG